MVGCGQGRFRTNLEKIAGARRCRGHPEAWRPASLMHASGLRLVGEAQALPQCGCGLRRCGFPRKHPCCKTTMTVGWAVISSADLPNAKLADLRFRPDGVFGKHRWKHSWKFPVWGVRFCWGGLGGWGGGYEC